MGAIRDAYNRLAEDRSEYLDNALFNERYTVQVGNDVDGNAFVRYRKGMYDTIGVTVTRALASLMISVLYPVQVFWFKMEPEGVDGKKVEKTTKLDNLLEEGESNMMRLFDSMQVKSCMYQAHLHAIISGNALVHLKVTSKGKKETEDPPRCRLFPLCQFVVERDGAWVKRVIVREPKTALNDEQKENGRWLYTSIDYVSGEVVQELEGQDGEDTTTKTGDDPKRWMVITNEIPRTGENYAKPYVDYYITKILHVNLLVRAFQEMVYEAAKVIKGVRPGSGLNPHELEKLESGAWVEMEEGDILYPEQTAQLSPGLQWVQQSIDINKNELKTEFQFGLLDRQPQPETATLARQLITEMNQLGAQFFSHHQDHTQLPLAIGLQSVTGFTVETEGATVTPKVVTGGSAVARRDEAEQLMQIIERLGKDDPNWRAQLPTNRIFQRLSNAFHLDTADLTSDRANAFDLVRELVGAIQKNPEVLPMVMAMIQEILPDQQEQQAPAELGLTDAAA